jgi:hypothetical protein
MTPIKYTSSTGKSVCILPASAVHIINEAEHTRLFNGENAFEAYAEPRLSFEIAQILAQELIKTEGFSPSSKFTASVVPWPEARQPWPIFVTMCGDTLTHPGDTVCDFYPENWTTPCNENVE